MDYSVDLNSGAISFKLQSEASEAASLSKLANSTTLPVLATSVAFLIASSLFTVKALIKIRVFAVKCAIS